MHSFLSDTSPWIATEAIILKTHLLAEKRQILIAFTKDLGMVKIIARNKKTPYGIGGFSELMKLEVVVHPTEKELWHCTEARPTCMYLHLRDSFNSLHWASFFLRVIITSQQLHHPAQPLYHLLDKTLLRIRSPIQKEMYTLATHFLIKLLAYDGLLGQEEQDPWPENVDFKHNHSNQNLNSAEIESLCQILQCTSWKDLLALPTDRALFHKTLSLFNRRTENTVVFEIDNALMQ